MGTAITYQFVTTFHNDRVSLLTYTIKSYCLHQKKEKKNKYNCGCQLIQFTSGLIKEYGNWLSEKSCIGAIPTLIKHRGQSVVLHRGQSVEQLSISLWFL